jgi:hypothetical protein
MRSPDSENNGNRENGECFAALGGNLSECFRIPNKVREKAQGVP